MRGMAPDLKVVAAMPCTRNAGRVPPSRVSTMVNIGADRSPERARQDYVKVIYQLGQRSAVRASDLARSLGVSRASVSKFRRMLEKDKLVQRSRQRSGDLRLTSKGLRLALQMVRRHRLVETFLHKSLHMPLEQVHGEAERIEHAISEDVSKRLAAFLHNPAHDPHGHRIPAVTSGNVRLRDRSLGLVPAGEAAIITSIDDRDAVAVRRFEMLGMLPGARVTVISQDAQSCSLRIGARSVSLRRDSIAAVRCTPAVATGRKR